MLIVVTTHQLQAACECPLTYLIAFFSKQRLHKSTLKLVRSLKEGCSREGRTEESGDKSKALLAFMVYVGAFAFEDPCQARGVFYGSV